MKRLNISQRHTAKGEGMEPSGLSEGYGQFWSTFNQAYWVMIRVAEKELRALDLTMSQAAVLFWVKTSETPLTPTDLSRLLFRRPHSVYDLLDRMEKQGLVTRTRDPKRKNVTRVILTSEGQLAFGRQKRVRAIAGILAELSPQETGMMLAALGKLRKRAIEELTSGVLPPYG